MTHPEFIVRLAALASEFEDGPADAAALLVDAAAMLGVEAKMNSSELSDRLMASFLTMEEAHSAVEVSGQSTVKRH